MEREGVARVKMFLVITVTYLIFWGPFFLVTLMNWSWEWKDAKKSMLHEVRAVMKTGCSLWELTHREFPVSSTGFGFTVY